MSTLLRLLRWTALAIPALGLLAFATTLGALRLEEHDPFCASCHTEPEHSFVERTLHPPIDLASRHATQRVRCIDCHTGPAGGQWGRLQGLQQGAQDLFAYLQGDYHDPAVTTRPLSDTSCIQCHTDTLGETGFNSHFHTFLPRWQLVAPDDAAGCVDCHSAHVVGGDPRVRTVCAACHATPGIDVR